MDSAELLQFESRCNVFMGIHIIVRLSDGLCENGLKENKLRFS